MPSPTTALDLIRGALGLTNAVGSDQTLTADEVSDCLEVFNDVLENWSTMSLAVYGQSDQTFNTVANQASYTIGPGGNWSTTRPVRINTPAYATVSGVTFPIQKINQAQYDLIGYKAQPGGMTNINQFFLYVPEYPLGVVTLWPVPNVAVPVTFSIDRVLSQVTNAATAISFPPGYAKAFKYTMGVELAPLFAKEIQDYPTVLETQKRTLADIKRANQQPVVLNYDPATLGNRFFTWRDGY